MKYKLISLILVSVLLISLNSCGGEMPTHESTVPSIPETPAATPSPETPAEQEPIPLDFEVFYADFAGLSDYRSETVMVVSDLTQYRLLCNSLVNMEALFYKYNEEFFEDHFLLHYGMRVTEAEVTAVAQREWLGGGNYVYIKELTDEEVPDTEHRIIWIEVEKDRWDECGFYPYVYE